MSRYVVLVKLDLAAQRLEKADEDPHQGGLADAIAPKQDQDIASPELEVDAQQNRNGTVGRVDVSNGQHAHCLPR